MKFSPDQIEQIEKLASIFLPVSDMAVILGVDPNLFKAEIRDYDSPARAAYMRGKALSKAALLAQEMKLAKVGSPLGLDSTRRSLANMEIDE